MSDFTQLAVIFLFAAIFVVITRKLKQPELVGFIFAGIFLGPVFSIIHPENGNLELFSKIGITFLLFIVGLELNLNEIKNLGLKVFLISFLQLGITAFLGMLLSLSLGFDTVSASYIGLGLSFSSTIVVVKLLSQRRELDTLHGKLSVTFLLVQDIIAIFALIFLSVSNDLHSTQLGMELLKLLAKGTALILILFIVVKFLFPLIFKLINKERETLFISIIAWAIAFSALVGSSFIGFSVEIGALLAGIALASRYENLQIESWMRPLRDFFLTLFFVLLGLKVRILNIQDVLLPAIVLSLFVLLVKPLITFIFIRMVGFPKRSAFITSISLGQISEFSLLLLTVAALSVPEKGVVTMTLVAIITIVFSSYFILYDAKIYKLLRPLFGPAELEEEKFEDTDFVLLLGSHRSGQNILEYLLKKHENVIVVDHNPLRVEHLRKSGVKVIMGDLRDEEFVNHLPFKQAKFVVSTIPGMEISKHIINHLNLIENPPKSLMLAKDESEIGELYKLGANYVIYPHFLVGENVKGILKRNPDQDKHKIKLLSRVLTN